MSRILDALKKVRDQRESPQGQVKKGKYTRVMSMRSLVDQMNEIKDHQIDSSIYDNSHLIYTLNNRIPNKHDTKLQNNLLIILAVVGSISMLISAITFLEIRKANMFSLTASKELLSQKTRIENLNKSLIQVRDKGSQQEANLKNKFNSFITLMSKNEKKMEDLATENQRLKSSINDMKWALQSLTDKITAVNSKVDKLNVNKQ